jgi:hypothetical protein
VLGRIGPFEQVAVHQLASETDPDPAAGDGLLVVPRRDQIIERPVQVSERYVHGYARDRQPLAGSLLLGLPPFRALFIRDARHRP